MVPNQRYVRRIGDTRNEKAWKFHHLPEPAICDKHTNIQCDNEIHFPEAKECMKKFN